MLVPRRWPLLLLATASQASEPTGMEMKGNGVQSICIRADRSSSILDLVKEKVHALGYRQLSMKRPAVLLGEVVAFGLFCDLVARVSFDLVGRGVINEELSGSQTPMLQACEGGDLQSAEPSCHQLARALRAWLGSVFLALLAAALASCRSKACRTRGCRCLATGKVSRSCSLVSISDESTSCDGSRPRSNSKASSEIENDLEMCGEERRDCYDRPKASMREEDRILRQQSSPRPGSSSSLTDIEIGNDIKYGSGSFVRRLTNQYERRIEVRKTSSGILEKA